MIYLDTNAVEAVSAMKHGLFSKAAQRLLDRDSDIRISPMVLLELQYLREIGRLRAGSREVLTKLHASIGLRVCDLPFESVAREAASESWTRDPFDRIIVAQARLAKAVLITRDTDIQAHYNLAIS